MYGEQYEYLLEFSTLNRPYDVILGSAFRACQERDIISCRRTWSSLFWEWDRVHAMFFWEWEKQKESIELTEAEKKTIAEAWDQW
jgi:hypothetical protein